MVNLRTSTYDSPQKMVRRDPLRLWISSNLQPLAFLGAYFATIVVGNLIFASPLGERVLSANDYSAKVLKLAHAFSLGYWVLLLAPFVITPLIVFVVRRLAGFYVQQASLCLPEFRVLDYAAITVACYAAVIFRFWQADVATLFTSGVDAVSSVEARFEILSRLGFFTMVILQALLSYLSFYALIRWMRSRSLLWMTFATMNIVLMSVLLIMLNMKWPVLLFYIGLVMAVFVHAARNAYLKAAVGAVMLVVMFLMVSTFVFRIAPPAQQPVAVEAPKETPQEAPNGLVLAEVAIGTSEAALNHAPMLLFGALNRMAVIFPYYYEIFTSEGAVCGGILEQARRGPVCRPSTLVYTRIFGADGFESRGTSPASVHVSGYALGGWPMAFAALIAGSVLLGIFASLPLDASATVGALGITGALAGYHLSQLPGEGVIFFDHGLFWTFGFLFIYAVLRGASRQQLGPQAVGPQKSTAVGDGEAAVVPRE